MFNNCKYFESANFTNWNLNNITSMEAMFQLCKNVQLENISRIIKNNQNGNLVNIRALFCKCTNLKFVPDIDRWFFILNNETRLKNMSMLFSGCKGLGSINLNSWRNIKFNYLEDISYMFNRCTNLVMIDNIKRFNTTRVTNMCGLFNGCKKLTTLSNFKLITQSAEDMSIMFQGCENLERIDNDFYDAKNLKDISGMFSNCYKLNSIKNIIYYTSDKLENMTALFKNCKALTSPPEYIKHNNWVWSSVKGVKEMFAGCDRFTTAPRWFLNMKFYAGTDYDNLLKDCKINNKDKIKSDWKNNEISRSEIK
jgi:surface protein